MTETLPGIAPANATSLGQWSPITLHTVGCHVDLDQCGKAEHVRRKRKLHPNGPCFLSFAGCRVHGGCHGRHHAAPNRIARAGPVPITKNIYPSRTYVMRRSSGRW
jgi:hypothetical protein